MKLSFITPENWMMSLFGKMTEYGHEIFINKCREDCDFIIGMSISKQDEIWKVHEQHPHIKLINYNWDLYRWQFEKPREFEYDWKKYGDLLRQSAEVWCPSICTLRRMKDFYGLTNGYLLKTFIPVRFLDGLEIKDERFALQGLRDLPDETVDWFERACGELNIPFVSSRSSQRRTWDEYKKLLATCSFTVSSYTEASTGGLHLIEGYYLGKPCLVSNSPYYGAGDYLGDRAHYFQYDDYEDFKVKLKEMWEKTPKLDLEDCRKFVLENYSVGKMAEKVNRRLHELR